MRHRVSGRKLNRTTAHRKAMFSNMICSLFRYEQIKTTLPKAKDLRPVAEKIITLGKKGTLDARRRILSLVKDREITAKVMDSLAVRYGERGGGYTRIIKAGFRHGDVAPIAFIELVDRDPNSKQRGEKESHSAVSSS